MTRYLIDTLRIPLQYATMTTPQISSVPMPPEAEQSWEGTYETLLAAENAFAALVHDRHCVAAALIRWHPGDVGGRVQLRHGDNLDRETAGGTPKQTILMSADRTWTRYESTGTVSYTGDWMVYVEPPRDVLPGYKLAPRG